jgi:hypothetical protein
VIWKRILKKKIPVPLRGRNDLPVRQMSPIGRTRFIYWISPIARGGSIMYLVGIHNGERYLLDSSNVYQVDVYGQTLGR